jgi:hypothetical protein
VSLEIGRQVTLFSERNGAEEYREIAETLEQLLHCKSLEVEDVEVKAGN